MPLSKIEDAIEDIKAGKMVVIVDDEDRENEGDLTIAALSHESGGRECGRPGEFGAFYACLRSLWRSPGLRCIPDC